MPLNSNKKTGTLSAITLCLVAVLLLIRINPIYYVAQFVPVRHADAHSMPVVRRAENQQSIVRCQRGISERIETVAVPQVKFTGIPFSVLFSSLTAAAIRPARANVFQGIILTGARRVAALRNLRL